MTFTEYLEAVARYCQAFKPHVRLGQAYFNVLYNNRPDLSEQIRGKELDPFYNDGLVAAFLQWVEENWDA